VEQAAVLRRRVFVARGGAESWRLRGHFFL